MELNAAQRDVVYDVTDLILLRAPAGTGKTSVLAQRVAHILAAGLATGPEILCLTFTNRACKELKTRIFSEAKDNGLSVEVRTIHSFCYNLVREEAKASESMYSDFLILDDEDCQQIVKDLARDMGAPLRVRALQSYLENEKKHRILPDLVLPKASDEAVQSWLEEHGKAFAQAYERRLAANHGADYSDLITIAYELLQDEACCQRWRERYKYIAVDEVQDTSEIEYTLLERLFPGRVVLLCGDWYQTIYEWRGSSPDYILKRFRAVYRPREITFTTNYRATPLLLQASEAYLQTFFKDVGHIHSEAGQTNPGEPVYRHEASTFMDEGRWIFAEIGKLPKDTWQHTCILVRANKDAKMIWNCVRAHNENVPPAGRLPFTTVDQFQLFKRQESKDVVAYLRLCLNRHDSLSVHRIADRFVRTVGEQSLKTIESKEYRQLGLTLADFADSQSLRYGDPYGLLQEALQAGRIVVFDVESTGTDTTTDDIIQIAAIRLNGSGHVQKKFMTYVKPTKSVGLSYYVHHISDEQLQREGKEPREAIEKFMEFAKDAVIVGHNVTYDLSILYSERQRLHIGGPVTWPYYDTLDIYRRFEPNLVNHKLATISEFIGTTDQPSHDAFDDIMATAAILRYALSQYIAPQTEARRQAMARYAPAFTDFATFIERLRCLSYTARPQDLVATVMNDGGVKAYYEQHKPFDNAAAEYPMDRVETIRRLYRIAAEGDDAAQNSRDALTEFLKVTSLSNSELDTMLAKKVQIPILTIHQAKGLEYDYVFLACLENEHFPTYQAVRRGDLSEEERLFYVAMTRAKKRLYLSWHTGEGDHALAVSPFVRAIPDDLCQDV